LETDRRRRPDARGGVLRPSNGEAHEGNPTQALRGPRVYFRQVTGTALGAWYRIGAEAQLILLAVVRL